jgi:hypothetical protein
MASVAVKAGSPSACRAAMRKVHSSPTLQEVGPVAMARLLMKVGRTSKVHELEAAMPLVGVLKEKTQPPVGHALREVRKKRARPP